MALPVKHDSNTDIFRGQLFLFVNDEPIAFASSASLDISTDEVDVSNKMMGDWAASLPGNKSFTLASESLLSNVSGQMSFTTLLDKQINSETLNFFLGEVTKTDATNLGGKFEKDLTKPSYTGVAMITSLSLTSDNGSIATCSVSLKGVGALVKTEGTPVVP